jgi:hypothetical protein
LQFTLRTRASETLDLCQCCHWHAGSSCVQLVTGTYSLPVIVRCAEATEQHSSLTSSSRASSASCLECLSSSLTSGTATAEGFHAGNAVPMSTSGLATDSSYKPQCGFRGSSSTTVPACWHVVKHSMLVHGMVTNLGILNWFAEAGGAGWTPADRLGT